MGESEEDLNGKMTMQIHALDHVFDELPSLEDINKYRILPMEDASCKSPQRSLVMNGYIYFKRPSEYPKSYLTFLGNSPGPANKWLAYQHMGWPGMDYKLCYHYLFWRDKEYMTVEEGIYDVYPT